ncbi:MAG: PadR family transcriptional regulator [Pirellulaceae bacterium]|jgi:DNA-binding PadR family transcriptional regulator|nr:PadR family transcriptional regulator [Thermoguttaceae bacterium]MDI9445697.1 PadR family transcriptional regulator [Planctomycetota bacterium]NLZ02396.1 PadR family transcriptional regulator [Pirellulaceae bacterium]
MPNANQCACTGKTLPRLLRPGIMAFLAQGDAHGYQIAQHLSGMRMFAGREPDHAGIYRALKEMADQGLVASSWQPGDAGPSKRVFALTEAGRDCLETWLSTLCDYRDAINELLALMRRAKQENDWRNDR